MIPSIKDSSGEILLYCSITPKTLSLLTFANAFWNSFDETPPALSSKPLYIALANVLPVFASCFAFAAIAVLSLPI